MAVNIQLRNGFVKINGEVFTGHDFNVDGQGTMTIDGKEMGKDLFNAKEIKFSIHGHVDSLCTSSGSIHAETVDEIETRSGSVVCTDVKGNVNTRSGSIVCESVNGSVSSRSGDISHRS